MPLPHSTIETCEGDHQIPAVRADQAMHILAVSVCHTINAFAASDKADDLKAGQCLFSIFVHQLASFSKEPQTMANLLRIVADEMERKAKETA